MIVFYFLIPKLYIKLRGLEAFPQLDGAAQ